MQAPPLLDLRKVALRNSIIFIQRDPQIALCLTAPAFSEQLSQKAREKDGPITLGGPQLALEGSELFSSSQYPDFENFSECPGTPRADKSTPIASVRKVYSLLSRRQWISTYQQQVIYIFNFLYHLPHIIVLIKVFLSLKGYP